MNNRWGMDAPHEPPLTRVLLVIGFVTIAELAMLAAIFLSHAQTTVPGLVLAVIWPWIAAFISSRQFLGTGPRPRPVEVRPKPAQCLLEARVR